MARSVPGAGAPGARRKLFGPLFSPESIHLSDILRQETLGGGLMLTATIIAIVWASVDLASYHAFVSARLGPLSVEHWAADGLLAIFFFVAGMELKRELVEGSLSRTADAAVPIIAAISGMAVPACIYIAINLRGGDLAGWATPMATDIAFALAVLAVVGSRLPASLRAFLLTLAIVDDLGAIIVIAVAFSHGINVIWLAGAVACAAVWALGQRRHVDHPLIYAVLFVMTWVCMYRSGVHATIAGVVLGLLTRTSAEEEHDPVDRWRRAIEPWSAAVAVPFFALVAAGVPVGRRELVAVFTHPVGLGIVLGLVAGKAIGVFCGAFLTARFTSAELGEGSRWGDVAGVSILAGIGFTVSLLVCELSFPDEATVAMAKEAVVSASVIAAMIAAVALRRQSGRR